MIDDRVQKLFNTPFSELVTRAEADAMVAAAYEDAADELMSCALVTEGDLSVDGAQRRIRSKASADARAAFERAVQEAVEKDRALDERAVTEMRDDAVQEAVEAERAKWQAAVTLIERVYYLEGKDAKWRAAHMNGIARDVQNGIDLAWARRMFPRDSEALVEARRVHADEAAAIRAPQEPSE